MARPTSMFLRAKDGLRVPYPESSYRYLEGEEAVEVDVRSHEQLEYWTRRLDHGEVERVEGPGARARMSPERARELGAPAVMVDLPSHGSKKEG